MISPRSTLKHIFPNSAVNWKYIKFSRLALEKSTSGLIVVYINKRPAPEILLKKMACKCATSFDRSLEITCSMFYKKYVCVSFIIYEADMIDIYF